MHTTLRETPLTVNPATPLAHRPVPVSLPYDLEPLPKDASVLLQNIRQTELPTLDTVAASSSQLLSPPPSSPSAHGTTAVETYNAWEKEIRRQNPGFNTAAYVMAPTVRR